MAWKRFTPLFVALLAFGLIHGLYNYTRMLNGLDRLVVDGLFFLREPAPDEANPFVSDRVRVIGLDEDAIAIVGKWPWKRYVHGEFLEKAQRFSPEAVFFDIIFAKPEEVPAYVENRLREDPDALFKVQGAFSAMDRTFAEVLGRYDNVYIDLQLVEQPRPHLPEEFQERIRFNERFLAEYAQPVEGVVSPLVFHSLEPILATYVQHAHPVVINVPTGPDGLVRLFPLFYTYRMEDGTQLNVNTVVTTLLLRYFHIGQDRLLLEPDRVVFQRARVPRLDPETSKTLRYARSVQGIVDNAAGLEAPPGYRYNRNLYRLVLQRIRDGGFSSHPVTVLEAGDGGLEILDGWEVLDAARDAGADTITVVVCQERDVVVETPIPGFYYVNYAGSEEVFRQDPETGRPVSYTPIATESYASLYTLDAPPDVPELGPGGTPLPDQDLTGLKEWFVGYSRQRSDALLARAGAELGEGAQDVERLLRFMRDQGEEGRYFFYAYYFDVADVEQWRFSELVAQYPAFGSEAGQDPKDFLSPEIATAALLDVYEERFDRYADQLLFAGATATGMADVKQTPYATMFGVNVIVNAFNTIATENQLSMTRDKGAVDVWLLLGLCLVGGFLYHLVDIRISALFFFVVLTATLIAAAAMFIGGNVVLSAVPLVLGNAAVFVGIAIVKLLTEERDKRFLKSTFSSYLSPALIEEMHKNQAHPSLGGEARVITAFFTDIQSFSTFSEKLTAVQLVELLNEYLTAMTDILMEEGGTLDKYEGDAIIAFFGAPMDLPDHEMRACRAAVKMQQRLGELREKWKAEKVPEGAAEPNQRNVPPDQWAPGDRWPRIVHEMRMRIGINTGEIVVGNMGSTMRMNYTMMGDAVNLAARLESAAKQYGVYTLVSEQSLDVEFLDEQGQEVRVMERVEARYLDRITVVGRSEPVRIYELMGMKGDLDEEEAELVEVFGEAMQHYLRMEWDPALEKFSEAYTLERYPNEKTTPSEVFLQRCRVFKAEPPVPEGEAWNGVVRLTAK